MKPLQDMRIVNLAINLPAPLAAARLRDFGADVLKVEPPSGDPLALGCRAYYDELVAGQQVITLDLKSKADRPQLDDYLAEADLLLTAHRKAALERLGLAWDKLHRQFPRLCHAALVGFPPPDDNRPGHDLMFQALSGLLDPPHMPKALIADMAAAEQMVSASMALLLTRERGGKCGYARVSIAEAGEQFAAPVRHGLTATGGLLSGVLPTYGIYQAKDGYIAIALLENHLLKTFTKALNIEKATREILEPLFLTRSAREWETWAMELNLPLAEVR